MPIQTRCPTCNSGYVLTDEQAGKKIRCRQCQTVFAGTPTPAASQAPPPVPAPAEAATTARRAPAPGTRPARKRPAPAAPRKQGTLLLLLLIGGSVLSVVVCLGVSTGGLIWWYTRQESANSKPLPGNNGAGGAVAEAANDQPPFPVAEPPAASDPAAAKAVADAEPPAANADPANPLAARVVEPPAAAADPEPAARGELAADVLHKVKNATLHLRVTLPDGNTAQGSGFFAVYPGVILTNAHVLGMLHADARKPQKIEVTQNSGRSDERKFQATFYAADRSADLAVLRAVTATVPPPLEVHSARGLRETQKVYVFGFPFGEALGKAVTVNDSSVSSLREQNGVLYRVQVHGGMNPGNSGGPVVDARGNVVGVSVSIIPNSQINFAVPGDSVHALLDGRMAGIDLDQSYYGTGDAVTLPVTLRTIDPLRRLRGVSLDVWTGSAGAARPPAAQQPPVLPGDSVRQVVALTYVPGSVHAEVALPSLPAGKVYWLQPRWLDASSQAHWDTALAYTPPPPVRRQGANLVLHHTEGDRPLEVSSKFAVRGHDMEGRRRSLLQSLTAHLQEKVSNVQPQGADVRLEYGKCDLDRTADGQKAELEAHERQAITDISRMAVLLHLDGQGNQVGQRRIDLNQVPPGSLAGVQQMNEQVQEALDLLAVPVPNKELAVGDSWKAWRTLPLNVGALPVQGAVRMTYTYLGRRTRNGREEAVVALRGVVHGRQQQLLQVGGQGHGSAAVDLASGRVHYASLSVLVELQGVTNEQSGDSGIALDVNLQRPLP
jgi:predicted Zn finger-like uncharacterized protein